MEEPLMCPKCDPCYDLWEESVSKGLKLAGGLGLVFSFTQVSQRAGRIVTVYGVHNVVCAHMYRLYTKGEVAQ